MINIYSYTFGQVARQLTIRGLCIHTYIDVYVCVHNYGKIYEHIYDKYMSTYIRTGGASTNDSWPVCTCIHSYIYLLIHVCMYIYIYLYMYIFIFIHVSMYMEKYKHIYDEYRPTYIVTGGASAVLPKPVKCIYSYV